MKHKEPKKAKTPEPCAACGGMGDCPNCGGAKCMACNYTGKCQECKGTGDKPNG